MKYSELFTRTRKEAPKDEESLNAKLLVRGGFIDKVMAGVYHMLPLGVRVMRKIENIVRSEMFTIGGQEVVLSSLQPKSAWEKTGRYTLYDTLFKFKSFYSKTEYVLGPTHEEAVSPMMTQFIHSYRDLPAYVFQIQTKFRDETRARSGLLRAREFLMKDLYSFHMDEKDLDAYYEKVKTAYGRIFKNTGIGEQTRTTFASGGTFSKYSHEFQTLAPHGEDTVYICKLCGTGVNREIIEEQRDCPKCGSADLKEERAIETGNIFKLKTRFSSPFSLAFKDRSGVNHEVYMGCYGLGITRLMGAVVEARHDKDGIVWPKSIAPYDAHLVCIGSESAITKKADALYEELLKKGTEALYDDRKEASPAEKLKDADLIGIPVRATISAKTGSKIEVKKRDESGVKMMTKEEFIKKYV